MAEGAAARVDEPLFEVMSPPTKGEVYKALLDAKGNISAAARSLGRFRSAIKRIIDSTPELVALLEDIREEHVDRAEFNIFADVEKGDAAQSRFVAQTLGKARGWSMGVSGLGKDGAITVEITSFAPKEGLP